MRRILGVSPCLLAAATLLSPGCKLQRKTDPLDLHALASNVENERARQTSLQEDLFREQAHVATLETEVAERMAREEALARDAADLEEMILEGEDLLADLQAQIAEQEQLILTLGNDLEAVRTPGDLAGLDARLEALRNEIVRLDQVRVALCAPPAPTATEPAAATAEAAPAPEAPAPDAAPAGAPPETPPAGDAGSGGS